MSKQNVIAFWSPVHGQCCTSSNLIAVSVLLALRYDVNALMMHNQYERSSLEYTFLKKEIESMEKGIDAIEKLCRANQIIPKDFFDYTEELLSNLYLLQGSTKVYKHDRRKLAETIQYIVYCARQNYDLVFTDLSSGLQNSITNKLLTDADLIMVCLNQNMKVLSDYFEDTVNYNEIKNKNHVILISNYDKSSKYTESYIRRIFKYKGDILVVPNNNEFRDAQNDHDVLKFFYANYDLSSTDSNYHFSKSVATIGDNILKRLKFNITMEEDALANVGSGVEKESTGLFSKFFGG